MNFRLKCIVFCLISSDITSIDAWNLTVGHYKVLRKSSKLSQCATKALIKSYNGLRVLKTTGECEAFNGSFPEEAIKEGYGYAKPFFVDKTYNPPVKVMSRQHFSLDAPGIFITTWKRLEVYVVWPWTWSIISFTFSSYDATRWIEIGVRETTIEIGNSEFDFGPYKTNDIQEKLPGKKCKISFLNTKYNSFQILFNGRSMIAADDPILYTATLSFLQVYLYSETVDAFVQIDGFELKADKF